MAKSTLLKYVNAQTHLGCHHKRLLAKTCDALGAVGLTRVDWSSRLWSIIYGQLSVTHETTTYLSLHVTTKYDCFYDISMRVELEMDACRYVHCE